MRQRFPSGADIGVDALLERLRAEPEGGRLSFGDGRVIEFLVRFARKLLVPGVARRYPELASLGFFLRKGEIAKAVRRMKTDPDTLRFPRGLVFHVPPANVDTIFVYSWALSALAGNHNVVRISPRSAGAAEAVLDAMDAALADAHPAVSQTQSMVSYDRDEALTAALSAAADLRVLWGGDASVNAVRNHPLAPHARDLTFPDRASFAAIAVDGWLGASAKQRQHAVEGFYNDAYWFDQAACSSPRTLFWVGDPATAATVREEFVEMLAATVADKAFVVEPAMAVQKRVAAYGTAANGFVESIRFASNAVAMLELSPPGLPIREWLGVGAFPQVTVGSLRELGNVVERKDQTLSHFGFGENDLRAFAGALGGRGIDRIVPFGSALAFAAIWDGYDLLGEFSRLTTVTL